MTDAWCDIALMRLRNGERLALVTLCGVEGSAPRDPGTRLLVWADGSAGTIGGGNLEFTVLNQARKLLAYGEFKPRLQDYPLGPLLGQCCGGHVRILIEPLDVRSVPWIEVMAAGRLVHSVLDLREPSPRRLLSAGEAAAFMGTPVEQSLSAAPLLLDGNRRTFSTVRPGRDHVRYVIEHHAHPRQPLVMFGAGHVGQAVARIVASLPFDVRWVDERPDYAKGDHALPIEIYPDPVAVVAELPPRSMALVFTHSHALDFRLVDALLRRGDTLYCGLIGSKTKRVRFESRLRAAGLSESACAHLTCPIGLAGITSKAPAAVAVAVAADLLLRLEQAARHADSPQLGETGS